MNKLALPSLRLWQLKYWAFLTGVASTGTKADLEAALHHSPQFQASENHGFNARRIVSVDMGIRNLAYCVIQRPAGEAGKEPLAVKTWKRMDLLNRLGRAQPTSLEEEASDTATVETAQKDASVLDKTAFLPSSMARTAYSITRELLKHEPDDILIERQRFRSGGAATILEWTIRVNMLESMIWACLETLRSITGTVLFPDVHSIDPKRVAAFWVAGKNVPLHPPLDMFQNGGTAELLKLAGTGRETIEKGDKVEIVRSWIRGESDVQLTFDNDAAKIAEAFTIPKRNARVAQQLAGGKLDDLADCLLQAVAHLRWQENRTRIHEMLDSGR
ncbi:Cruciform cutting endonuclease 1, mitochondrial [Pseudocercospora fuligena]|uniref:Cruciform cutting endonuclease 1, mitochondrial n=1 Tax=Pseudocercospora fuligena TaxID=685502 RepID=A0A8H6RPS3_9PEZI|nr:Cruciform cutting endonuclease 1, mitochondrial [Pseudocercospora fuligena]